MSFCRSCAKFSILVVITVIIVPLSSFLFQTYTDDEAPSLDYGTGSMFDQISTRYDMINRVLTMNLDTGWRRVMVTEVFDRVESSKGKEEDVRILDLATGTADVALLLAEEGNKRGLTSTSSYESPIILGIDPSENMLSVGRTKVESRSMTNLIRLETGDVRKLNHLEDNSFDAATMSFGIRNVVHDRNVGLCEVHRVLKKGVGTFAILEFSEPTDSDILSVMARWFIKNVVPVVGSALSGKPKEYLHLQNSIKNFPAPKEFVGIMESLECGDDGLGTFKFLTKGENDGFVQMNFGSVQLYLATAVMREK